MTWICLKCGNALCWIHDGGAYCPNCGAVEVRYEEDQVILDEAL